MQNNIIVIPARYNSSRFPGKVIKDLCGKPVVQHVYERCIKSKKANSVIIATDHESVLNTCHHFTNDVVLTSSEHLSGTDRVAEAIAEVTCTNVVNIQGDEPFISTQLIDELFNALEGTNVQMVSAYHRIENQDELNNINIVKVILDSNNNAIYFSRHGIPFLRLPKTFNDFTYYRHIGVYGYKADFLRRYVEMSHSKLENAEQLEQLRVLEAGYKIQMIETKETSLGIDTPQDLEIAISKMEELNATM